MKDKKTYIMLVVSILFTVIGVSLAYFSLNIIGNDTAKYNTITTGDLALTYTDTSELSFDNALPGDSITKTITVKNTGTEEVSYNLTWQELTNTITNNELVIEGTCKSLNSSNTGDGECSAISKKVVKEGNVTSNIPIKPGYTHEYTITITFIDTGRSQNYNKNKTFKGKLGLTESSAKTIYCTYDGELTQGAEYVNGQYTYRYMQENSLSENEDGDLTVDTWTNIDSDGWGVRLTSNVTSDIVNVSGNICTFINNKPVVSTAYMFANRKIENLDISSFNTSKIINMKGMFKNNRIVTLDLSSFNTSKVTNMGWMFSQSRASTLDLSNFDTSNVTDMSAMFDQTKATTISGLNNFNTSNVTNMQGMFLGSYATTLDLNNFDTSKVTLMYFMFFGSKAEQIDISAFDTTNVKSMHWMFGGNDLKTIYVGGKFKIDNLNDEAVFSNCTNLVGGAGTAYDSNHTDKTYAHIDGGTSNPGYFTDVKDKPNSFSTDSWNVIIKAVRNNNISNYKVGDTKTINMGTYGTHTIRIANTSTPSECSTSGFSQSACGFVLEFEDSIILDKIDSSAKSIGGWPASELYSKVNNDIYNSLSSELKSVIIDTPVVSSYGSDDSSNFISTDKLYLLATKEVFMDFDSTADTSMSLTRTLDYYVKNGVTTSNYSAAIKKNGSSAITWSLRSAMNTTYMFYYAVLSSGSLGRCAIAADFGVAPAFRIG